MKTKHTIGVSAIPALLVAAGLLSGCTNTEPVGEYSSHQFYYNSSPGVVHTSSTTRRIEPVGESTIIAPRTETRVRTYRTLEPVGESTLHPYGYPGRPLTRDYNAMAPERITPYGPNSPTSPSQWW